MGIKSDQYGSLLVPMTMSVKHSFVLPDSLQMNYGKLIEELMDVIKKEVKWKYM